MDSGSAGIPEANTLRMLRDYSVYDACADSTFTVVFVFHGCYGTLHQISVLNGVVSSDSSGALTAEEALTGLKLIYGALFLPALQRGPPSPWHLLEAAWPLIFVFTSETVVVA